MMRNQPPGFRWLVGGFALAATVAFGFQYRSTDEPTDLILGVLCLVVAGYWLIFDREPAADDSGGDDSGGDEVADDYLADDHAVGDHLSVDGKSVVDQRPDHHGPEISR
ncbi:MAG TPA: hypothetical protein VGB75_13665 [Jatrophihabitans sp.]|jgi:hypothetical protein|uniref:hypothetical protein n=1 Tax=Jatrophihabitans sp. TaxID=1932789 RepID=UPI002EE28BC6